MFCVSRLLCILCSVPYCYINCSNKFLTLVSAPLKYSLSCSLYVFCILCIFLSKLNDDDDDDDDYDDDDDDDDDDETQTSHRIV